MQFLTKFSSQARANKRVAGKLYDIVIKQALHIELYQQGVAVDTFQGRFEQLCLHAALMMRALRERGQSDIANVFSESVFAGFDHAHREKGAGDSSISRKVRKSGEQFYGLARGLEQGLVAEDQQVLRGFIERNGLANGQEDRLASYLRRADKALRHSQALEITLWPEV